MRYLTLSETLEIHIRIIAQSGGTLGILNLGALESALAQPQMTMNYPAASGGVSEDATETIPKASPPNVSIGGPVPNPPGFPLTTCGNEGLREGNQFNAASCGKYDPQRFNGVDLYHTAIEKAQG